MTPMAHRAPARRSPCPGCATCRQRISLGDLVGFVGVLLFVIGMLAWAAGQP